MVKIKMTTSMSPTNGLTKRSWINNAMEISTMNSPTDKMAYFLWNPNFIARIMVLVQIFDRRQTEPIFNFSLHGKHCFPYLQDHGSWTGDLRCVELSFFDFVFQLDSA